MSLRDGKIPKGELRIHTGKGEVKEGKEDRYFRDTREYKRFTKQGDHRPRF